jgi:hypothetical protein
MVTNVQSLSRLFDRVIKANHPWYSLHSSGAQSASPIHTQAFHANLSMDNRVSLNAETQLLSKLPLNTDLARSVGSFFVANYCRDKSTVKFIASSISLPPQRKLFRLGSLTGMVSRIIKNADLRSALQLNLSQIYGTSRPIPDSGAVNMSELAELMNDGGEDNFREVIEIIHDLLGANQPFWWATFAAEVTEYDRSPELLCDALGLGEHLNDSALLMYEYKVSDAGLIYKPTVIESNGYAFHYPMDNSADAGLTMSLSQHAKPCTEVLHHPLLASAAAIAVEPKVYWLNDKNRQLANQYGQLNQQRKAHRQHITKNYRSATTTAWLNRHSHLP